MHHHADGAIEGIRHVKAPSRSSGRDHAPVQVLVAKIIADVRDHGDKAVRDYALQFDRSDLESFEVTAPERAAAVAALDPQTRADTQFAIDNVRRFAQAQLNTILPLEVEPLPGLHLGHRVIPVGRGPKEPR